MSAKLARRLDEEAVLARVVGQLSWQALRRLVRTARRMAHCQKAPVQHPVDQQSL